MARGPLASGGDYYGADFVVEALTPRGRRRRRAQSRARLRLLLRALAAAPRGGVSGRGVAWRGSERRRRGVGRCERARRRLRDLGQRPAAPVPRRPLRPGLRDLDLVAFRRAGGGALAGGDAQAHRSRRSSRVHGARARVGGLQRACRVPPARAARGDRPSAVPRRVLVRERVRRAGRLRRAPPGVGHRVHDVRVAAARRDPAVARRLLCGRPQPGQSGRHRAPSRHPNTRRTAPRNPRAAAESSPSTRSTAWRIRSSSRQEGDPSTRRRVPPPRRARARLAGPRRSAGHAPQAEPLPVPHGRHRPSPGPRRAAPGRSPTGWSRRAAPAAARLPATATR